MDSQAASEPRVMLSAFFAKRRLRKQLSKFLSAEAADSIADGRIGTPRIQAGRIDFVFVFVRADSTEELADRTGLVSEIGTEHGAVVHALVGPLVTMAFGTLKAAQHQPRSRITLVNHLQQRLGSDARI